MQTHILDGAATAMDIYDSEHYIKITFIVVHGSEACVFVP